MKQTVKDFFSTETYSVQRGYTIHISRDPRFATEAVVEDDDGVCTLIDVADADWDDFDDFVDAVIERYESLPGRYWMTAAEAEERWGLQPGTVRSSCQRGPLKENAGVRKSGNTWLVTTRAMTEVYGPEKSKEDES